MPGKTTTEPIAFQATTLRAPQPTVVDQHDQHDTSGQQQMFKIMTAVAGFYDSNTIVDGGVEQPQDVVLFLFNVVLVKGQRF